MPHSRKDLHVMPPGIKKTQLKKHQININTHRNILHSTVQPAAVFPWLHKYHLSVIVLQPPSPSEIKLSVIRKFQFITYCITLLVGTPGTFSDSIITLFEAMSHEESSSNSKADCQSLHSA